MIALLMIIGMVQVFFCAGLGIIVSVILGAILNWDEETITASSIGITLFLFVLTCMLYGI